MSTKETTILLAHGGGGRLSHDLITSEILTRFPSPTLRALPDAATLPATGDQPLIFSTDSFVVQPLFFPGGNIGHLAVHGTVNDIAAAGGKPLWLSLALIMEEGFSLADLRRILDSIRDAAAECGVTVVTGDTKVVGKGQCDGLYINTAGIGTLLPGFDLNRTRIQPGDRILTSGPLAEHGFAVMSARRNIGIQNGPSSDTAPVHRLTAAVQKLAGEIRFFRDPTRGGLAAVLNEIADGSKFGIELDEKLIPLSPQVRAISEMLGLDPLQAASEGRIICACSAAAAPKVLDAWRKLPEGHNAVEIGVVTEKAGMVVLRTLIGGTRIVDLPRGELLPRIC